MKAAPCLWPKERPGKGRRVLDSDKVGLELHWSGSSGDSRCRPHVSQ